MAPETPAGRRLAAAARCRRGLVAAELALIAPVFFLILLATADVVRVFRAQIRMEMIAVQIGQIVSQCARITDPGDLTEFWGHAARIADGAVDVNSPSGGAMIISALSLQNNVNTLNWQRRTGNATTASAFGTTAAPTPVIRGVNAAAFLVPAGQTLFATEVFGRVPPGTLSAGLIGTFLPQDLQGMTLFLSRASDPARLQQAPITPVPPAALRECTA